MGEVEQLANEKQVIEERLSTSLTTLEQLVKEKEDMFRENEELRESERKAVKGEIINQRFERQEAAAKFQVRDDNCPAAFCLHPPPFVCSANPKDALSMRRDASSTIAPLPSDACFHSPGATFRTLMGKARCYKKS